MHTYYNLSQFVDSDGPLNINFKNWYSEFCLVLKYRVHFSMLA